MGQGDEHHQTTALDMLNAFASVSANRFDVTWTDGTGQLVLFRRDRGLAELTRSMPPMLDTTIAERRNLIVRPYGRPVFLQLDDLDAAALRRMRPAAFLTLDTSPGNHQAWIALEEGEGEDFARHVRKGSGAGPPGTASGIRESRPQGA